MFGIWAHHIQGEFCQVEWDPPIMRDLRKRNQIKIQKNSGKIFFVSYKFVN